MDVIIFENALVILTNQILKNASVVVEDGKIAEIIGRGQTPPCSMGLTPKIKKINLKGNYLSPGFIDLHLHGAVGCDTMDANLKSWNRISRYHASGGTTSLALTTVPSSWKDLERVLKLASRKPKLSGAQLLGLHLEGPFLSKNMIGALMAQYLCEPLPELWQKILSHASSMTQMTIAPELQGAVQLIKALKKHDIITSAGHTDANESQMQRAFSAGLDNATHLFNRMAGTDKQNPKNQKDAAKFVLQNPIYAEIIADGTHIPIPLLRETWKQKGTDFLTLITDATAGAGLKNGSKFLVGKMIPSQIRNGHAYVLNTNTLAGSTIRMIDAVRVMVEKVGVPLRDAVRMASYNPAKRLKLEHKLGSIQIGNQADFVVFDKNFKVLQIWRAGEDFAIAA